MAKPNKTVRVQPNRITREQAFAADDVMRAHIITSTEDGTVEYDGTTSDEEIAEANGMTVASVVKLRKERYGCLPEEASGKGAANAALIRRIQYLEKKVEAMVVWMNDVDRHLRADKLKSVEDTVQPILFENDLQGGPADAA